MAGETVIDPSKVTDATKAVDAQTESLNRHQIAVEDATKKIDSFDKVQDILHVTLDSAGKILEDINSKLKESSSVFTFAATAAFGANEQFKNLGSDTSNLNTFTKQFDGVINSIKNAPAGTAATSLFKDLANAISKIPGGEAVAEIVKAGGEGAVKMATAFLKNADNIMIAQNAMYMMAGSTGNLSNIMDGMNGVLSVAGTGLEHINRTSSDYINQLDAIARATGGNREAALVWAGEIGKMPGGLQAIMEASKGTIDSMNGVEMAMKYSAGSGLAWKDMAGLMTQGMHTYNMSAADSVGYTARAGEILNTFKGKGLLIDDVNKALMSANDTMKNLVFGEANATTMTQNMSSAMEQYVGQLTAVGVPGAQAAVMFDNLTKKMHDLSTGQLAFLSQRTGGPGGLAGSFEMLKLQREHPEQAMAKMQEALKKQMGGGELMTLDKLKPGSQADAAKLQREIAMMTQGPLKMAGSRDEALAMLESMSGKGAKEDYTKDKGKFLEQSIDIGKRREEQQQTKIGEAKMNIEAAQITAGQFTYNAMPGAFTARTGMAGGIDGTGAGIGTDKAQMRMGMEATGAEKHNAIENVMKNMGNLVTSLGPNITNSVKSLGESFSGTNRETIEHAKLKLNEAIAQRRSEIAHGTAPDDIKAKENKQLDIFSKRMQEAATTKTEDRHATAGRQVGAAIPRSQSSAVADKHTAPGLNRATGPIPVTLVGSGLTVNFTGKCPHCNKEVNTSASAEAISPHINRNPTA